MICWGFGRMPSEPKVFSPILAAGILCPRLDIIVENFSILAVKSRLFTFLVFYFFTVFVAISRRLCGLLTIVWDASPIHRNRLVQDYVKGTGGRILLERLPAYTPELNPMEHTWSDLKQHQIGNLICTQTWELSFDATAALRRMRRRRSIIGACYQQSTLGPE